MNQDYDIEIKAQRERTVQAINEGWMGFDGKLGVIAQQLGDPIMSNYSISHEGGLDYTDFSTYSLEDEGSIEDAKNYDEMLAKMPMIEDEYIGVLEGGIWSNRKKTKMNTGLIGWNFDGLSRGMHLEIRCLIEDAKIVVYYQGYKVYEEEGSKLLRLNPNGWEELVERLYPTAKKKQRKQVTKRNEERKAEAQNEVKGMLQRIKELWGL